MCCTQLETLEGRVFKNEREFLISPFPGTKYIIRGLSSQQCMSENATVLNFGKRPFDWMTEEQWQNLLVCTVDIMCVLVLCWCRCWHPIFHGFMTCWTRSIRTIKRLSGGHLVKAWPLKPCPPLTLLVKSLFTDFYGVMHACMHAHTRMRTHARTRMHTTPLT